MGVICSLLGYSQTIQQQVEKEIKDPQRKAAAGKADVVIPDKKKIFDSTTFYRSTIDAVESKKGSTNATKRKCSVKATRNRKQKG